jgi:subtilisin family serine protease
MIFMSEAIIGRVATMSATVLFGRVRLIVILSAWAFIAPSVVLAGYGENDLIVKFKPGISQRRARAALISRNVLVRGGVGMERVLVVEGGANPQSLAQRLATDSSIESVERNRRIFLADTTPNDPNFPNQWQLKNTGQTGGVVDADIDAPEAWDLTTGSATVVLAVVDTGLWRGHPEIEPRVWNNLGEIPANGLDDDSNGFVDDVEGWDFSSNTNDIATTSGHGTAVAGIAGGMTNNGLGTAGVDWNCRLMMVKIFSDTGFATTADAVAGVVYAVDNGARVINASWGSPGYSPLLADMAEYARARGALIVAASGNYSFNGDEHPFFPAALDEPGVLSVGGTNASDGWVYNYGASTVDVSAPGYLTYIMYANNFYGAANGTSFAAPLAAGTASLMLALDPALTPMQLKWRIMAGADSVRALDARSRTSGRLNAFGALSLDDATSPSAIGNLGVVRAASNGALLSFTAPGNDGAAGRARFYDARVTSGPLNSATFDQLPEVDIHLEPQPSGSVQEFFVNSLEPGTTYRAALRAVDEAGNTGDISNVVTFVTSEPTTVFSDACETTHPTWTANGFTLAYGPGYTGDYCWQDSPMETYAAGTTATLTSGEISMAGLTRPRLHYRLEYYFPSRFDQADRFEVGVSVDGGASWVPVRRHGATVSPYRLMTVDLDDFATAPSVRVQFMVVADADSQVDDGVYLDDIRISDAGDLVPEVREHILEPVDFFGLPAFADVRPLGSWQEVTAFRSRAVGVDGRAALRTAGGTNASVAYVPLITTPGIYEVSVTHGIGPSSPATEWRVTSTTGTAVMAINQTASPHEWIPLGRYAFTLGRGSLNGSVLLNALGSAVGDVSADAVRFRLVEPDFTASINQWKEYEN